MTSLFIQAPLEFSSFPTVLLISTMLRLSLNMASTQLATNAYMLTHQPKYKSWVLGYADAWAQRARDNGGIIPSKVGVDGKIGGPKNQWWGSAYGWGFSPIVPMTGKPADRLEFTEVRAVEGLRETYVAIGDRAVHVGVANGLTNANLRWLGTASIYVVGGSGPTPGPNPVAGGVNYAQDYKQTYNPPLNGEAAVPTARTLSKVYWKPLSYTAAYKLGVLGGGSAMVEVETILVDAGTPTAPLVTRVEVPRHGKTLAFLRGLLEQDGRKLLSYSATILLRPKT